MPATPGLLFVRMNPHSDLSPEEFHDWYNNEHGPIRLRLSCIENGFRYRALDVAETKFTRYETSDLDASSKQILDSQFPAPHKTKAEWLAIYDIDDMAGLEDESYLRLRSPPWKSEREISVMSRIDVDRRLYHQLQVTKSETYRPLDSLPELASNSNILIVVSHTIEITNASALVKWYNDVRIPLLQKEISWKRTQLFATSSTETSESITEVVVLHDFASEDTQASLQLEATDCTSGDLDWVNRDSNKVELRPYELYYIFGPAPRHLSATAPKYEHPVEGTKTTSANTILGRSIVSSYITTSDGVKIPYFLEGSVEPDAPVLVLSNSVLVDWSIWDDFVDSFFSQEKNKHYRILRYETRGRSSNVGTQQITVDLLAKDILTLLDHLRVEEAGALIGVSLGGATVLNFALNYPDRLKAVISCDTNSNSPPGNSKLWLERIAVAEEENVSSATVDGKREIVIGENLAELTVRRWAVPASYDGGDLEAKVSKVKQSVISNSLSGFKSVVKALWDYDLRTKMKTATVSALFVVGGGDGKLPSSMQEMANDYGNGADLKVIEGAGHLPMVEKPHEFAQIVTNFLARP